jgi:hypothetical protein
VDSIYFLVVKVNRSLGNPDRRWKDIIKIGGKETTCGDMNPFHLAP